MLTRNKLAKHRRDAQTSAVSFDHTPSLYAHTVKSFVPVIPFPPPFGHLFVDSPPNIYAYTHIYINVYKYIYIHMSMESLPYAPILYVFILYRRSHARSCSLAPSPSLRPVSLRTTRRTARSFVPRTNESKPRGETCGALYIFLTPFGLSLTRLGSSIHKRPSSESRRSPESLCSHDSLSAHLYINVYTVVCRYVHMRMCVNYVYVHVHLCGCVRACTR